MREHLLRRDDPKIMKRKQTLTVISRGNRMAKSLSRRSNLWEGISVLINPMSSQVPIHTNGCHTSQMKMSSGWHMEGAGPRLSPFFWCHVTRAQTIGAAGFLGDLLALNNQVVTFLHSHDVPLLTLYTCLLFNPFIVVHPPGGTLTRRHKSSVLIVEIFNLHEPSLCTRGSEKTVIADDRWSFWFTPEDHLFNASLFTAVVVAVIWIH